MKEPVIYDWLFDPDADIKGVRLVRGKRGVRVQILKRSWTYATLTSTGSGLHLYTHRNKQSCVALERRGDLIYGMRTGWWLKRFTDPIIDKRR